METMSDAYIPTNLPQRDYIQGLWHLDENAVGGIPAFDYSGNGNHLTDVNTTTANSGGKLSSYCRDFEASNSEYLYITDANQTGLDIAGDNLVIAAWIKLEAGNTQMIATKWVENDECYYLFLDGTAKINFSISKDGTSLTSETGDTTISAGTWYHVCGVYNGTDIRVYVDGLLDNASPTSLTGNIHDDTTANFCVGADSAGNYPFDGLIDEVIVWNTALTAAEVLAVKNITAYTYATGNFFKIL